MRLITTLFQCTSLRTSCILVSTYLFVQTAFVDMPNALCFVDLKYVLCFIAFDSLAVYSGRTIVQSAGVAFDGTLKRALSAADILSLVTFLNYR